MDRRIFTALMTLAAAAGTSTTLGVELAAAQSSASPISRDAILQAAYKAAMMPDGVMVGTKAFTQAGYSPAEAGPMAQALVDLAKKAGSYPRFQAAIDGNAPSGLTLDAKQSSMLRTIAAKGGSGGAKSLGAFGSGRTWEGSANLAVSPNKGVLTGAKPVLVDSGRVTAKEAKEAKAVGAHK